MDSIDRKILQALQEDASGSISDIADRAGVSQTPCWRRIKKLEDAGFIDKRVALLNQKALNLKMTAFVMIKTSQHDEAWLKQFSDGLRFRFIHDQRALLWVWVLVVTQRAYTAHPQSLFLRS